MRTSTIRQSFHRLSAATGALLAAAALFPAEDAMALPFSDRITLPSGEKIFLSGFNLAWINFANDVGDTPLNETAFRNAMQATADSGGNTMRVWLSTNGANDPKFGADGLVTGLGTATIANVQKMLAIAKETDMLLMPVFLTHNFMQQQSGVNFDNNRKMLTTDEGIQAYIDNAVLPLVQAIGNDPNLVCWEIANEAEGMVEGVGWTNQKISKEAVQKFTNRMTGAIKRAVPGVLVSTGIVQAAYLNWYDDATLVSVGGDADGKLDFYQVHYYGWNGTGNSPFRKGAAAWGVDKPVVVGEFASSSWSPSTPSTSPMQDAEQVDTLLENLYKNGYAGGLFWQYQPDAGDPWMKGFETAAPSMAAFMRAHPEDVTFDGISDGKVSLVASGTAGGSVTASPLGRVAPGTQVTLTAAPQTGFEFTGWSGDTTAAPTVNPLVIAVSKDMRVVANFKPAAGTNLLQNGDFASAVGWEFNLYAQGAAAGTASYAAGQADIHITAAGAENWHAQLQTQGIPLQAGATYVVSFDGWADAAREVQVGLTTSTWEWQSGATVSLTATKSTHQVEVTATDTIPAGTIGVLQFNIGEKVSTLHFDNIVMAVKSGSPVLGRPGMASRGGLQLSLSRGGLRWALPAPLAEPAILVIRDVQGRQLARYPVAPGERSGVLPAILSPGMFTGHMEIPGARGRRLLD